VIDIDIKNMDHYLTLASRRESQALQMWQRKLSQVHALDFQDQ
jgi:hypothetical protein